MSEAFDRLVPEAQDFCTRLAADNTREWYAAHKDEYHAHLKAPAELLLETLRPQIAAMTGADCSTRLFRINRDLRFARGLPPYKDHLHMLWYSPASAEPPLAWFLGIDRDRVRIGAGYMQFEGATLLHWRAALAGPAGEDIDDGIGAMLAQGFTMRAAALKRVPPPYPQDHPRSALLKRKGLTLWADLPVPARGFDQAVLASFALLLPLMQRIRAALARASQGDTP